MRGRETGERPVAGHPGEPIGAAPGEVVHAIFDEAPGVRAVDVFVRSHTEEPAHLVATVGRGEPRAGVSRRVPLSEPATVRAEAAAGTLRGKVVVVPEG